MEPLTPQPPGPPARPVPPRQDCPDVADCFEDAAEIGHICSYGPICGTCVVYRPREIERGLLLGTCRIRTDRGAFPCTAPICESYLPRAGALDAKGQSTEGGQPLMVQIARATREAAGLKHERRATPAAPAPRPRIPDGPCGELEMTRAELKELIREAMDEERGGGPAAMAPKWEGGMVLLKPADPALQAKELPLDALLHKVVMIRDKLRVLEQKLNAHPKLTDAEKIDLQAYVTGCYGSLTTFNVLFRDRQDGFAGSGGKDK
ncbi:MAG TPA: hypothetical protein VN874_08350 [Myxococcales bacterium]|jgi:hypothetical protein|nr:hypothetical protein [Myxococcales bacterium]